MEWTIRSCLKAEATQIRRAARSLSEMPSRWASVVNSSLIGDGKSSIIDIVSRLLKHEYRLPRANRTPSEWTEARCKISHRRSRASPVHNRQCDVKAIINGTLCLTRDFQRQQSQRSGRKDRQRNQLDCEIHVRWVRFLNPAPYLGGLKSSAGGVSRRLSFGQQPLTSTNFVRRTSGRRPLAKKFISSYR